MSPLPLLSPSLLSPLLGLAFVAVTPHAPVPPRDEQEAVVIVDNPLLDHLAGPGCHVVPAFANGRPVGVKVFGLRGAPALQAAGLQDGDVIVRADGIDLARPDGLLALSSSPLPLVVTVERRGVRHQLWLR